MPPRVRQDRKLHFPLARRLRAEGRRSRAATASIATHDGTSERALFVIDADGVIRWSYVSPVGVNPGADGILDALEASAEREGRCHDADLTSAGDADADHARARAERRSRWSNTATTNARTAAQAYPIVKEVQQRLGRSAALRLPQLPADEIHPARPARRRGRRGRGRRAQFWEMHDALVRAPARARAAAYLAFAEGSGSTAGAEQG